MEEYKASRRFDVLFRRDGQGWGGPEQRGGWAMGVVSLELNELNFHYIRDYAAAGHLPNFQRLLQDAAMVETDAGEAYPELEPWIQWPTVYTGKTYREHGIFRLGDAVYRKQTQIWEYLEARGVKVGAVSPMNAANRCRAPAFFLPDPWTETPLTADAKAARLYGIIKRIVNDNASSETSTAGFARQILPLALPFLSGRSISDYFRILPTALRYKWAKAGFLDRLLTDLFVALYQQHRPGFASLFLNGGAHIQHHYTYDSAVYTGERSNPGWYSRAADTGRDPLLFIYKLYDAIVAELMALKDTHVMISTGLSQVPNERDHYQYRIVDFEGFFAKVGLQGATIQPRMSRDFLLAFPNSDAARAARPVLDAVRCAGKPLFTVEDRGETLFCQVGYFGPPEGLAHVSIDGVEGDHSEAFVLVSIENAIHQSTGYFIDTQKSRAAQATRRMPLAESFDRLCTAVLGEAAQVRAA
jgi:hypothetical protein